MSAGSQIGCPIDVPRGSQSGQNSYVSVTDENDRFCHDIRSFHGIVPLFLGSLCDCRQLNDLPTGAEKRTPEGAKHYRQEKSGEKGGAQCESNSPMA